MRVGALVVCKGVNECLRMPVAEFVAGRLG